MRRISPLANFASRQQGHKKGDQDAQRFQLSSYTERQVDSEPTPSLVLLFRLPRALSFGRNPPRWRLYCPLGSIPTPLQRDTAMLSSTTGSSAEKTKNTSIPPVINIASFSFLWTRYSKVGRSPIAPIFLSTTTRPLPAVGLRVIRSVSPRYSRPGITPRQERQVPPSRRDRSLLAPFQRADNALLRG